MNIDSVNQGVITKLQERAARGEKKYGVTMDRTDLTVREWLQHAQDELLDGAVYLEKLIRLNGTCKYGVQNTGCGERRIYVDDPDIVLNFCPFCGRKIEEEK
jgi:hypothetical protein